MAKIVIVGLGPLGVKTVRFAVQRKSLDIVGAVDINPLSRGRTWARTAG